MGHPTFVMGRHVGGWGFVVSHPFAMRLRMDGAPGLRDGAACGRLGICGFPPIRDETANGWGTRRLW